MDSFHLKWYNLQKIGNWSFLPGHTLSGKNIDIIADTCIISIKTQVGGKHMELLVRVILNLLVKKSHLCDCFPKLSAPDNCSNCETYDFAYDIRDLSAILRFCTAPGVINEM